MSKAMNAALMPYGAFELKARYQHNLLLGDFLMMLIVSAVAGGIFFFSALIEVKVSPEPRVVPPATTMFEPPPTIVRKPPEITNVVPAPAAILKGTMPIPVPAERLKESDAVIPTKDQLGDFNQSHTPESSSEGTGFGVLAQPDDGDYLPDAGEFVPHEVAPGMIYEAAPDFPRLAQLSRQEGVVWIKALVDKNGNVRQALVFKSSGLKVGFEEAAISAAYKCKYRPAIQNGRPVAVWVTYKVEFTLTGREKIDDRK